MPRYSKRLLCLANSLKKGGRCVAGIEIDSRKWVRPVGDRESGGVLPSEYSYLSQRPCKLLDIVDVPLLRAEP